MALTKPNPAQSDHRSQPLAISGIPPHTPVRTAPRKERFLATRSVDTGIGRSSPMVKWRDMYRFFGIFQPIHPVKMDRLCRRTKVFSSGNPCRSPPSPKSDYAGHPLRKSPSAPRMTCSPSPPRTDKTRTSCGIDRPCGCPKRLLDTPNPPTYYQLATSF